MGIPIALCLWVRLFRLNESAHNAVLAFCMIVCGLLSAIFQEGFWEALHDWTLGKKRWWDPRTSW